VSRTLVFIDPDIARHANTMPRYVARAVKAEIAPIETTLREMKSVAKLQATGIELVIAELKLARLSGGKPMSDAAGKENGVSGAPTGAEGQPDDLKPPSGKEVEELIAKSKQPRPRLALSGAKGKAMTIQKASPARRIVSNRQAMSAAEGKALAEAHEPHKDAKRKKEGHKNEKPCRG
jgi:hypothetical protein